MKFLFSLFFLCFSMLVSAQENSNKTLIRLLDPKESTSLVIRFKTVSITKMPWDDQGFYFELQIKANMPKYVIDELHRIGRYEIDGVQYADSFYIIAPNLDKNITFRGKDLEEKITLIVKTPGNYDLTDNVITKNMDYLTSRDGNDFKMKDYMKIKNKIQVSNPIVQSTLKGNSKLKLKTGDILVDGVPLELSKK